MTFRNWYVYTGTLVGCVILPLLLGYAAQVAFFTTSCAWAGWKCEYGIGADTAMTAIGHVLDDDPEAEVVVKRNKR